MRFVERARWAGAPLFFELVIRSLDMEKKQTGVVRSWRGSFGFIERDDNGTGLFIHQSDLVMEGYRQLTPGERVSYDIAETDRGPKAVHVEVIE